MKFTKTDFKLESLENCTFDLANPFDLDIPIINIDTNLHSYQTIFTKLAYKKWLDYEYSGESKVTIAYQYILDNIKAGKYQNYFRDFTQHQYDSLFLYFEDTINEEKKHVKHWEYLGKKIYQDKFQLINLQNQDFNNEVINFIETEGLLPALTCFFIGETFTLTSCSMFYKHSTNKIKKQFLKVFLTEEVKHINGFANLMKAVIKNCDIESILKAKNVYPNFYGQNFNFFGINQLFEINNLYQKNNNIENLLLKSIIHNEWQIKFNEFLLKKNFLFYKNFDENISADSFYDKMNSKWSEYIEY